MISVIIPCIAKHAHLLQGLLDTYNQQTMLPDEIIIAISGDFNLKELYALRSDIPLKISPTKQKKYAGENRQRGVGVSHGDILIFNDADDIPHRQRIEITHHFMNKYHKVHLNGLWQHEDFEFDYAISRIQYVNTNEILLKTVSERSAYGSFLQQRVHAGNVAVHRNVFEMIQWTNKKIGQDKLFCLDVLRVFRHSVIVLVPLIQYRLNLSSWKPEDDDIK